MAFTQFKPYMEKFLQIHKINGPVSQDVSDEHGIKIIQAEVAEGASYWKVIGIHALTPDENSGQHNVFIDALDESGQAIRNHSKIRVGTRAHTHLPDDNPRSLDKPLTETGTDVPIEKNDRRDVWIRDALASDRVVNLNTRLDRIDLTRDNQIGNSRYHHSFYVVFMQSTRAKTVQAISTLVQYANVHDMGKPLTPEFELVAHRIQVFTQGVVYTPAGEAGDMQHVRW